MTRPRAADDFPIIRARMEELRRERARPRAADDFPMIRARMEELRRERAPAIGRKKEPFSGSAGGLVIVPRGVDRAESGDTGAPAYASHRWSGRR